jgi:hypothetical protein
MSGPNEPPAAKAPIEILADQLDEIASLEQGSPREAEPMWDIADFWERRADLCDAVETARDLISLPLQDLPSVAIHNLRIC